MSGPRVWINGEEAEQRNGPSVSVRFDYDDTLPNYAPTSMLPDVPRNSPARQADEVGYDAACGRNG